MKTILYLAFCVSLVGADKLDKVLASAIFPASSGVCKGTVGSTTSFSFTYTSTFNVSKWEPENKDYESNVFEVDITHTDSIQDRNWAMRIGKGGQISSFIVAAGESIANQANAKAKWNDLVQQMVAVNGVLNKQAPNFIHQAGPYVKDTLMDGIPFYSPNLALDCSEDYCSTVNWGQQAHVPTSFDSPLLYYTRYRDCGDGVIEYDMAMHHFGKDATDQYDYCNTPWTGVRTSTFRDMMISNTNGQLEHAFPMTKFGKQLRNLDATGGFTTFAEDLELASDKEFDFGYCVNTTANPPGGVANTACNELDPNVIPFVLKVAENSTASKTGHYKNYGVDYTVRMRLCDLTAPITDFMNGWGNPYDGVLLTNDRSGFTFASDFLIHPCFQGTTTFFSSNVSAAVLNEEFIAGDTISIKYVTSGMPMESQHALTFVHGTNSEWPKDWYRAKSRIRYGTTTNRRDGTVWTTNWIGKLNPSETYFARKYIVTDKLANTETVAAGLTGEAFEDVEEVEDMNPGQIIKLWMDDAAFGASIATETCSVSTASIACTGSSTPKDGFEPWFHIRCGNIAATSSDPYHFGLIEENNKKPYICVDETGEMTRPKWKLLGFFDATCSSLGSREYVSDFCDESAAPSVASSESPSGTPSLAPSSTPSVVPSQSPSGTPSLAPSSTPSVVPSQSPSGTPSLAPSSTPSVVPSQSPSGTPSLAPSSTPSVVPSQSPSLVPSTSPSQAPSGAPSVADSTCENSVDWAFQTGKDCDWVAKNPYNNEQHTAGRCFRKDQNDGTRAIQGCPLACSSCPPAPCENSIDWEFQAGKDCDWVAEKPYNNDLKTTGRCFRRDKDDDKVAVQECPLACGMCT